MAKAVRLNAKEGAAHLGMAMSTFNKYRYTTYAPGGELPTFPPPDADGTWLPSVLTRWNKSRPGLGGPGVSRPKSTYPCEVCGTLVKRRIKDDIDGKLKCRPCHSAADPALAE